jgi:hypothetical protein
MRRRLSSIFTFPAVISGPALLVSAGLLALYLYVLRESSAPSTLPWLVGLLAFMGMVVWVTFLWHRSRRVLVDDEKFYVSNYFLNEITIPIRSIDHIEEVIHSRHNFVELHVVEPTRIGRVIRFMPRLQANSRFNHTDPIAGELRQMIASAKSRA